MSAAHAAAPHMWAKGAATAARHAGEGMAAAAVLVARGNRRGSDSGLAAPTLAESANPLVTALSGRMATPDIGEVL
jgi:hypothetical protein